MNAADTKPPLTPLQQLQQSRERLRAALIAPLNTQNAKTKAGTPGWQTSLMSLPGVSLVVDAVQRWWSQHPMRAAASVAEEAGKALIGPTAQKHPLLLMLGALMLGAALVRVKPWRWGFKKALLAGLLPQLISKVLSDMPVSSWIAVLSRLAQEHRPETRDQTTHPTPGVGS